MKQQYVLRHMVEVEHGVDNYVDDDATYQSGCYQGEFIHAGRLIKVSLVDEDGVVEDVELWRPPGETTATRSFPARTKAHSRGYLVDMRTNRKISFASTHELYCALVLMTNIAVVDIEDQPPAVPYQDADGLWHEHTFDFRSTLRNGVRLAYAVKPMDKVESSGIQNVLKWTKPNLVGFADAAILVTDRTLTRNRAWNAKWTLRAMKLRDVDHCQVMWKMVRDIQGIVSAFALARKFDRFADGLNAILCLVYDGVIELTEPHKKLVDAPWIKVRADG